MSIGEEITTTRLCNVCGGIIGDATKCSKCGVPQGDLLEQVITALDKYEEGCTPRTVHEYDCMCGLDEFHPWKKEKNWKDGRPFVP